MKSKYYRFATIFPLFTREETMEYFLEFHIINVFGDDYKISYTDGSYVEIVDNNGELWGLLAADRGDFTNHAIRIESFGITESDTRIEQNKQILPTIISAQIQCVDEIFLKGLRRKGYSFNSSDEIKRFILSYCDGKVESDGRKLFFVKGVPFLAMKYDEHFEFSQIEKNRFIQTHLEFEFL